MSMIVNRRDLDFILFEMLESDELSNREEFANFDRSAMNQILDAAQTLAEDVFLPIAAEVDADEPQFVNGQVVQPAATGEALRAYAEGGFFGLPFDEEQGGLGAPWTLYTAASGMMVAANTPVSNYAFLTIAAANLLNSFGSEEQKALYLPPMIAGEWFGTMCLSEPQAGSSLGDIRTQAIPLEDGSFSIQGSKMWISGGDQAITENIIHMVLAKLPGAPAGSKGISLFVVPKMRVDANGRVAGPNNIALAGLNHKLGQRATTNCLLNFGESGETIGWIIGEPGRGLEYMFHMMNEARIGVGHAAAMAGLAGYLYSADYARTRTQGRAFGDRNAANPMVPIIQHVDVRRMLLQQKAAVEGAQALSLYCSRLVDDIASHPEADARKEAVALLGLLTPAAKSWPSEHCLEANKWAIQILGGYGYTRDYPLERLYRDNRLNHIHEGTFAIQGMDLLGRKICGDEGATLNRLILRIRQTIASARETGGLEVDAAKLEQGVAALETACEAILGCAEPEQKIANATLFLDAFGHVMIGWMWLWQARIAEDHLKEDLGEAESSFYRGKRLACEYFTQHELPLAITQLELCGSLVSTALKAEPSIFDN